MSLPKPYYETELGRLYHADCLTIMPYLESVDLVLTDPPYEIECKGAGIAAKRKYLKDIDNFTNLGFEINILDKFKNWFCFCSKEQLIRLLVKAEKYPRWMLITWNKSNPTPLSSGNYLPDTEYIIHAFQKNRCFGGYKDKSRFIFYPAKQNNLHPNEKPIPVVSKLIRLGTNENDIILDMFLGSGTTAVACERLKRRWIGIEIEEKYCEIAAKRIEKERSKLSIFDNKEIKSFQMNLFETPKQKKGKKK